MPDFKLAANLQPADMVWLTSKNRALQRQAYTVVAVTETVQTIQRKVLTLTLRDDRGHETRRRCNPNFTFRLAPETAKGD